MEINFRAWVKPIQIFENRFCGHMIDVPVINFKNRWVFDCKETVYEFREIILMQSTDLIDVKAVQIFDKDIVKLTEKTINGGIYTHTCKVFQSKSGAWRIEYHPDSSRKYTTKRELYSVRNRVEIIGNTLKNRDLLDSE